MIPQPLPLVAGISLRALHIRHLASLIEELDAVSNGSSADRYRTSLLEAIASLAEQLQEDSDRLYAELHEKFAGPPGARSLRERGGADFERFSA